MFCNHIRHINHSFILEFINQNFYFLIFNHSKQFNLFVKSYIYTSGFSAFSFRNETFNILFYISELIFSQFMCTFLHHQTSFQK